MESVFTIAWNTHNGSIPRRLGDFDQLESVGVTGSPLAAAGFEWLKEYVKQDLWIISTSGGTDVAGSFVGGSPLVPVRAGRIQARLLGVAAYAFDPAGRPVDNQVGELVITQPMPSMPLHFWGDEGDSAYRAAYFERYPGVWCHGDSIEFDGDGSSVIHGRSDATINRHGVRMGTAEIYSALEGLAELDDFLVVDLEQLGLESLMPLFVKLAPGASLDTELTARINERIRTLASPRHVPDAVFAAPDLPRTLNGKRMEVPVRRVLLGTPAAEFTSAAANPDSLAFFECLRDQLAEARERTATRNR